MARSFLGSLLGALDGFNLLEEESADDAGLDATTAKDTSVGSGDRLVFLGKALIVVRPELGNAIDAFSAIAAVMRSARTVSTLLHILHNNS